MSHRLGRALLAAFAIGSIGVLLAGCDYDIYQSPGGIRLDGDHVEFAVCEPIEGARILVFGDEGAGTDEVQYMEATGQVRLDPQTLLSSAEPPPGFDATFWNEPVATPGARVALFVYDEYGDVEFPVEFSIPQQGLSETLWTRSDGRQDVDACD